MNLLRLKGQQVLIGANDISKTSLPAEVIEVSSDNSVAVLKLKFSLVIRDDFFSYAVVSVRHKGHCLDELINDQNIICAVTFVSDKQFTPTNPFDLSWWRGGNAAIANLSPGSSISVKKEIKNKINLS